MSAKEENVEIDWNVLVPGSLELLGKATVLSLGLFFLLKFIGVF